MTAPSSTIEDRLAAIQGRVAEAAMRSGRDAGDVTIVGVSKTVAWPEIARAYDAGLRHFGENRVQDARARIPADHPIDFILHMIGQLQTNKVGQALDLFDTFESIDRPSLIDELEKQAAKRERIVPVLLQVNIAAEDQKAGCDPADAPALTRQIATCAHLSLQGLMTMAPLVEDVELARPTFRGLRTLRDRLADDLGIALPTLSMGMSNDFPIAIEEGATHVRIGRAIFQS